MIRPIPEIDAEIARLQAEREEALRPFDEAAAALRAVWFDVNGWSSLREWKHACAAEREKWRTLARAAAEHFEKAPGAKPTTECEP